MPTFRFGTPPALRALTCAAVTVLALAAASAPASADSVPPSVTVTQPTTDETLTGSTTLAAVASDDVGVVTVKWYVDGVQVAFDADGAPWSAAWDSARIANGAHKIFAKARDAAGNWGSSPTISFNVNNPAQSVDTTTPTVSVLSPKPGQVVQGNAVPLAANAFDNVGVTRVKWYIDGTEVATDSDGAPWLRDWDSRRVANGTHRILAKARDVAGNWAASVSVAFEVSNPPPPTGAPKGGHQPAGGGKPVTSPAPAPPDTTRPDVSYFAFVPGIFRALGSGPAMVARYSNGTRVGYRLSEPALATFTVRRATLGRRAGRRCVKQTPANRNRRPCLRYVPLRGSLTRQSRKGWNGFGFTGRLGGRRLGPGRYRMVLVATDPAGNRSRPLSRVFRVVR